MTTPQDRSSRLKARLSEAEAITKLPPAPVPTPKQEVRELLTKEQPNEQKVKPLKKQTKESYRQTHKMLGVWLHNDLLKRLDEATDKVGKSKASIVAQAIEEELKRMDIW